FFFNRSNKPGFFCSNCGTGALGWRDGSGRVGAIRSRRSPNAGEEAVVMSGSLDGGGVGQFGLLAARKASALVGRGAAAIDWAAIAAINAFFCRAASAARSSSASRRARFVATLPCDPYRFEVAPDDGVTVSPASCPLPTAT